MSETKGYYSVIQYCPDRSRMEAANFGVLLLCPDLGFVKAKMAEGNDRIRRFFRGQSIDLARINAVKRSIERRVEIDRDNFRSKEDLIRFMDTRGNDILLTPPRSIKVDKPEAEISSLFAELVGGRARRDKKTPEIPALDQALRRPTLKQRIIFDHQVSIPVLQRPLKVPYAFRNGVLNLIKPQRFPADEGHATSTAMRLAVEGDLLHKHSENGEQCKLIVVSVYVQAKSEQTIQDRIDKLFSEYNVRLVRDNEIDKFAAEVESQAH